MMAGVHEGDTGHLVLRRPGGHATMWWPGTRLHKLFGPTGSKWTSDLIEETVEGDLVVLDLDISEQSLTTPGERALIDETGGGTRAVAETIKGSRTMRR